MKYNDIFHESYHRNSVKAKSGAVKMEPGNPDPVHGTGSQKILTAVPLPAISSLQPVVIFNYRLCSRQKKLSFKCALSTTEHGVG